MRSGQYTQVLDDLVQELVTTIGSLSDLMESGL